MQPLFVGLAVLLAATIGFVHLHLPDAGLAFLLVLAAAMLLGVAQPKRPWVWALILGVSLPATELYSRVAGDVLYPGRFQGAIVIGIASGLVGAYGGAFMRQMARNVFNQKS